MIFIKDMKENLNLCYHQVKKAYIYGMDTWRIYLEIPFKMKKDGTASLGIIMNLLGHMKMDALSPV